MTSAAGQYLYLTADLAQTGVVADAALAQTTERHHAELVVSQCRAVADPLAEVSRSTAPGVIFELASGLPSARHLALIDQAIGSGQRVWLYWPGEQAVECVASERLHSLRRQLTGVAWLKRLCGPLDRAAVRWQRVPAALRWIYRGEFPVRRSDVLAKLDALSAGAAPPSFHSILAGGDGFRLSGVGLYLRADYWATTPDDVSLVRELTGIAERLVCLIPHQNLLLDGIDARQIVMDQPRLTAGQDAIVLAPTHYWPIVKATGQALGPAYLYERMSVGQSAGAELSQLLGLPYIVEYPGSDTLLRDALNGTAPTFPELYAKAEEVSLRQATVVVVPSSTLKDDVVARGVDANRVLVDPCDAGIGRRLAAFIEAQLRREQPVTNIQTGDAYKDQIQAQWNRNPVGSHYVRESQPHTLEWFLEVERHRYGTYAPWMPRVMEFSQHRGHEVLEIGGGIGTDLAQFAAHGAAVTDLDLSAGHLCLAEENLQRRGLQGRFIHHDAEELPFDDESFDVVYSNGVLHHTPNTVAVIREIARVLRPGGRAIVMVYSESSLHFWRKLVWQLGIQQGLLEHVSIGEIMSRSVERSANEARPLVKVYTKRRLRALFDGFTEVDIFQRQLLAEELPRALRWTRPLSERFLGWNLIAKATKPHANRQVRLRPEEASGRVRH